MPNSPGVSQSGRRRAGPAKGLGTKNYTALFEEAIEAGRKRDYARSVEILLRIVGSTDRLPQALLYLGRSYHALGQHARAVQALNFYVQQKPGSSAGHFFLGRAYLALEAWPSAIRHLRRATEANPRFAPAYGLLGFAWLKARRSEKAIWCFAKALELDPNNKRLQVGYLNTALVLAIRLFYRGQLLDSARLFNEVLEQRTSSILPHLYLATIYKELGKNNASLFHIDAATQMSPQDPFLHLQKALVLLSQDQKKEAAEELRVGTQLLKSSVGPESNAKDVLRFITVNLFRERRFRETILYGTRLLKDDYGDPQLHTLVGESYRNLGELTKAKNHFLRALEKDKGSLEIRYGLFAVLWDRGEFEELLTESGRLLQKNPTDEAARYFHSLAQARTGAAIEKVLSELQQQVSARGPDLALMAELAATYVRAGLPDLAEGWYKRVLRISKDDLDALEGLAAIYETLGKAGESGRGPPALPQPGSRRQAGPTTAGAAPFAHGVLCRGRGADRDAAPPGASQCKAEGRPGPRLSQDRKIRRGSRRPAGPPQHGPDVRRPHEGRGVLPGQDRRAYRGHPGHGELHEGERRKPLPAAHARGAALPGEHPGEIRRALPARSPWLPGTGGQTATWEWCIGAWETTTMQKNSWQRRRC